MTAWRVSEARAEDAAQTLLDSRQVSSIPVCPFALAEADNIVVKSFTPNEKSFNGCLVRNGNAFGILYADHIQNEGFIRFTVSHELGHYHIPGHCIELLKTGAHYSDVSLTNMNPYEREADLFAAALLMPTIPVMRILQSEGPGFGAIEAIASKQCCHVSLTAAAIRYSRLTRDGSLVVLSRDGRIEAPFLSEVLRELNGVTWPRRGNRVPPNSATRTLASIKGPHAERADAVGRLSQWISGAPDVSVTEEAISLGSYGKVLTVLTCTEAIDIDEHNEPPEPEDAFENLGLPSERGYFEKRRRRP